MTCNSKMAGHRAKWSGIWDSMTIVKLVHIWGTFDLAGFKIILESVHLSQNRLYLKMVVHRQKSSKFGTRGHIYGIHLTL